MENNCNINHPLDDVRNKYEFQKEYLPTEMNASFESFFNHEHTQDILNDVFHLLKKYDLATEEEREHRNKRLYMVLHNL
ncbi:group-specific protein [Robertmurraya korlensis]|uniref:group-specific protein n=1 Tax=Robertmurraya korlensis TaxID=519977 RepID=UPI0008257322|nr:group-specific protein [Robertmurraya korlensis]